MQDSSCHCLGLCYILLVVAAAWAGGVIPLHMILIPLKCYVTYKQWCMDLLDHSRKTHIQSQMFCTLGSGQAAQCPSVILERCTKGYSQSLGVVQPLSWVYTGAQSKAAWS